MRKVNMGRTPGYNKEIEKEKRLDRNTIIQEMLNKEDIGTKELAIIASVDERSIRNILSKLCEQHDLLAIEDFKDGKSYKFKASWNGLLATLIQLADHSQYDNRKEQYTLDGYFEYINALTRSIDLYLNDMDQAMVKTHGTYSQAVLEQQLYEQVIQQLGSITNQISMMPASLRFQTLAGVHELLKPISSHMAQKHSGYLIEKSIYKQKESASMNETSFQEGLEEYLVSLLCVKMMGQNGIEEPYNMEVAGSTLLEQFVLGNLSGAEIKGMETLINRTREDMLEMTTIKPILEKVMAVLDEENQMEKLVGHWIEETLLLLTYTINNKDGNKLLGKELVRQMVTKEVYRNLQEFTR